MVNLNAFPSRFRAHREGVDQRGAGHDKNVMAALVGNQLRGGQILSSGLPLDASPEIAFLPFRRTVCSKPWIFH